MFYHFIIDEQVVSFTF